MLSRLMRAIRRNAVAWLALFVATAGTGVAASRYIITSTSQIKPTVLRQLSAAVPEATTAAVPKGPKATIARVRLSGGPVALAEGGEEAVIPVSGANWTQAAGQSNAVVGQVIVTSPPRELCGGGRVTVSIDHSPAFVGVSHIEPRGETEETATYGFEWVQRGAENSGEGGTAWILDSATASSHTIRAVGSGCAPGHHLILDSLEIDVFGLR